MSSWDDADFYSSDPLTRHNAHQAAKGRSPIPDPDVVRKAVRESGCAACAGDPEAHDLHVCGKEPFA